LQANIKWTGCETPDRGSLRRRRGEFGGHQSLHLLGRHARDAHGGLEVAFFRSTY
jgi:hypothetical protein